MNDFTYGQFVGEFKMTKVNPSKLCGKNATMIVMDEITRVFPDMNKDKAQLYAEACGELEVEKPKEQKAWYHRRIALYERNYKRFKWIEWVEMQARSPFGQPWCKELIARAIALKLSE